MPPALNATFEEDLLSQIESILDPARYFGFTFPSAAGPIFFGLFSIISGKEATGRSSFA